MKIDRLGNKNIINLYKSKFIKNNIEVNKTTKKDSIEISEKGKIISNLSNGDVKIPDKATVEKIKAQINNGTYNVDSKKLAKAIVESMRGKEK